jgi:hypothetical protein
MPGAPAAKVTPALYTLDRRLISFTGHTVDFDAIIQRCPGPERIPALGAEGEGVGVSLPTPGRRAGRLSGARRLARM